MSKPKPQSNNPGRSANQDTARRLMSAPANKKAAHWAAECGCENPLRGGCRRLFGFGLGFESRFMTFDIRHPALAFLAFVVLSAHKFN
jgi:hypothetical protein